MTVLFILVLSTVAIVSGLFLAATGRFLKRNDPSEIGSQIQAVDLEAFRNLVSVEDTAFLRASMPARQFRSVQRTRMLAAVEYVNCVARNATVLMGLGESARASADPAIATAGRELVDTALRLRLYSLLVLVKLYFGVVLPGVRLSPATIADQYQHMSGLVGQLSRMQYPSRTARIPASL